MLDKFFKKQIINEHSLDLDDPRWAKLEGGYHGSFCDASIPLRKLEQANTIEGVNIIYTELWDELHHQGDVGVASYYAVPHLVRIAKRAQFFDYNVFALVSIIEIRRHKDNPPIPKAFEQTYKQSIIDLSELGKLAMNQEWDINMANSALAAIAISKGQLKLGEAIFNLDSEDRIDEYLNNC